MTPEITVGMAAIPERFENLRRIAPILARQCDTLRIHVNGAAEPPEFLKECPNVVATASERNLGDMMKFAGIGLANGYFLSVDDDILYPADYVARMVEAVHRAGGAAIVCVCGGVFNPELPVEGVFHRLAQAHFSDGIAAPRRLMVGGTGTLCMDTRHFAIAPEECPTPNMADIYTACKAARLGIPIICVAREKNWLVQLPEGGKAVRLQNPYETIEKVIEEHKPFFAPIYEQIAAACRVGSCAAGTLTPLISVVTLASGNHAGLRRALNSLAKQQYAKLEALVACDGQDETRKILDDFSGALKLRAFVSPVRENPAAARNAACKAATGELIAYLDDETYFFPNHLATLATMAQTTPNCVAAYTTGLRLTTSVGEGGQAEDHAVILESEFDRQKMLIANYIPLTCLIHWRSALDEIGLFDESLAALEDWDFILRLAFAGDFAFFARVTSETKEAANAPRRDDLSSGYVSAYRLICDRFAGRASPDAREAQEQKAREYVDILRRSRALAKPASRAVESACRT